ncbi:TIR domain-containing protein [Pseudoxanthomonas daejeonensis]|uniref:TIR domain-containing protein n=1 Tax=Pseudoxanthomonas daejeonensis TaxID=266062 RepID=UPI001F53F65F|nr:TIR domain-containing protein [Pseudoxanthomonas daejeonensis]UNK57247.1 TIR domain-containing protein [Pseudoxanthomonas daejeonensis]
MADIFVSYSRQDRARVAPLVAALEAQGWSVWWDPEINPGEEFDSLISRELEGARSLIVVWTPQSVDSRWVRGEARDAADRGVLVPVRFEHAKLPIDFRALHATDLDDWDGDRGHAAFVSLCKALEGKLGAPKPDPVPARKSSQVSICVLPFANMSGDPEQEYFSDGITEDIITDLGKVSALSIVSRNLAFSFKGATGGVADIGRQTKATHVLAGSVRKAGDRVRITAQLVDAARDSQVWGERYDRDLNDIFALQDEISKAIVSALKLTLLPQEKQALEQRATTNAEAYKLYLMARQFWLRDNERNNEIVIRICKHVVKLDPNYAQAWATMALAQWNLFWQADLAYEDLEYPAKRALELGPHLADSHAAWSATLRSVGKFGEALEAADRAVALEPESYVANRLAGLSCMGLRLYDRAIGYFEVAANAMESDFTAASFIVQACETKGDVARVQAAAERTMKRIEKIVADDPGHGRAIGFGVSMLVTLGQKDRAMEWATRAHLVDPENANLQYNLACAMSLLGEYGRALDILEDVVSRSSQGMLSWIETDSDLDPIRSDPRYDGMIGGARDRLALKADVQPA